MAHDLNITNGKASFVSLRKSAWHGLGTVVNAEMNDTELLAAAGLNWTVTEEPIFAASVTPLPGGDSITAHREIPGHKLLARSDTRQDLAVVSTGFRAFQNAEMVALMRSIGGDAMVWETAGALGATGATTWAMARLPDLAIALGSDVTEMYMLLTNGHGNNRALVVMPTMVRVVCANTMRAAEGDRRAQQRRIDNMDRKDYTPTALAAGYGIHNNEGLDRAVADVAAAYKSCLANRDATKVAFDMMARAAITDADARQYWERIFAAPVAADETERSAAMRLEREAKRRRSLAGIWASPTSRTEAAAGTVFGAFQAAVEYIDHEAPARSPGSRAFRAVMGSDVAIKRAAWDEALALAAVA